MSPLRTHSTWLSDGGGAYVSKVLQILHFQFQSICHFYFNLPLCASFHLSLRAPRCFSLKCHSMFPAALFAINKYEHISIWSLVSSPTRWSADPFLFPFGSRLLCCGYPHHAERAVSIHLSGEGRVDVNRAVSAFFLFICKCVSSLGKKWELR